MSFKEQFLWGASSAAYQIEGGFDADGKGPGIWDALGHKPGRIARGESGDIACDHYHRYQEDVALMKEIGLKHYRFSISWPRIMPKGTGETNPKGLEFYSNLVDELLAAGIEPMVTLYHWNMPYALFQQGGWLHPDSSCWFEEYVSQVVSTLGSRVRLWLTFNEPQMFMFLGYQMGVHAPFEHYSDEQLLAMTRNILLAHGKAVKVIRKALGDRALISFSPTGDTFVPAEETPEAIQAAYDKSLSMGEQFIFSNTWWADPVFFGRFPQEAHDRFGDRMISFSEEEWALVTQKLDFFSYNIYQSMASFGPHGLENPEYEYPGCPMTTANWCVVPECLYWSARFWSERYQLPVFVTENGVSLMDWVSLDGAVHDPLRIDFLARYLGCLKRAADEGIDLMGYTYWNIMDECEWAGGYKDRYGLIHVDFRTLKRTIKDSGHWYRRVIETNGEELPSYREAAQM